MQVTSMRSAALEDCVSRLSGEDVAALFNALTALDALAEELLAERTQGLAGSAR